MELPGDGRAAPTSSSVAWVTLAAPPLCPLALGKSVQGWRGRAHTVRVARAQRAPPQANQRRHSSKEDKPTPGGSGHGPAAGARLLPWRDGPLERPWRRAWRTWLTGRVAVSAAPSRHRHGRRQRGAGLQGRAGRPPPCPGGGLCWGQDVRRQKLGGFRETLGHTPPGGRAKPSLPHCTCAGPVTCGHEFSFAVYAFSSRVWVRTPGFAKDRLTLKEADTRNLKSRNFFVGPES